MNSDLNRVRWRCRRGHLELDLCLRQFVDRGYEKLSEKERDIFLYLLEQSDETLWNWFVQAQTVDDVELSELVAKIRSI